MTQPAHQEASGDLPNATSQRRCRLSTLSLIVSCFAGCAAHPTPPETTAVYGDDPAKGASPLAIERWSVSEPDATTVGAHDASTEPSEPEHAPKRDADQPDVAQPSDADQPNAAQPSDADQPDVAQPSDADQPSPIQPQPGPSGSGQPPSAPTTP